MDYTPTMGLEVHIELRTGSKMFCSCSNDSQEKKPNTNVCPVCLGHPGTLPSINEEAVKKAVKTALALNCQIQSPTCFERKNYFYPDLPKGYQISQYAVPLSKNGYLKIAGKKICIERVHLEEDTGKLVHPLGKDYSLVDFNRAGIPLMELVTEPDISSAQEARVFAKELQLILRYLGVSGADMEKGEMRVEVNISLAAEGAKNLGTKVEIKNLNSLRAIEKATEYEIKRQTEVLRKGKKVMQETRGWDERKAISFPQREKEESHDYRYFPEPDLPPLSLSREFLQESVLGTGELPLTKRARFKKEYNLSDREIELFVFQKDLGEYFEKVISELRSWVRTKSEGGQRVEEGGLAKLIKLASNYIATDLQALLKGRAFVEKKFPITPENFAEFLSMIYLGEISSKIAKVILQEMFRKGGDPSQLIEEKGLAQISDISEIEKIVKEVVAKNPKPVEDYKKGKETALQFLVGQVMKKTKGKASPGLVNQVLKKLCSPPRRNYTKK